MIQRIKKLSTVSPRDQLHTIRIMKAGMLLLLMACFISSCYPKSTPPGANSVSGSVGHTLYWYHHWQEGLAILVWHDFSYGESNCGGSSSTEDPLYRINCIVKAGDGRQFSWEIHSSDGLRADMWIEGQKFDLSQGTMFLVGSRDNELALVQLQKDFSALAPSYETVSALAISDIDVANFVNNAEPENAPLDGGTNDGVVGFAEEEMVIVSSQNEPAVEPAYSYEAATYQNEAHGFEFDYPATWRFEEDVLGERGSEEYEVSSPDPVRTQPHREIKTGIPQVDPVIDTILNNDLEARQALVRLVTVGCTTAGVLGSTPKCEDGQAEGTLVDYLPIGGPGDGSSALASEVAKFLEFEAETLYAAYVVSEDLPDEPEYPHGTYALFFTVSDGESGTASIVLRVDDEGYIVRLDSLVGIPLDFYFQQRAADLIDPPPQSVIFSSEAAEILVYPPENNK